MNLNQNPFSIYDFLGYLVPGIFFVLGLVVVYYLPSEKSFEYLQKIISSENIILIIIVCYFIGHLLSFISSITIEKYSIWTLGYPSQYLLGKGKLPFWKSIITKNYDEDKRITSVIGIASRFFIKIFISILIFPITFLDIICRHIMRLKDQYGRSLDEGLTEVIRSELNKFLKDRFSITSKQKSKDNEQDYFRVIYHYAIEYAPNHFSKMQNYVALYGYTRTIAFSLALLFWVAIYKIESISIEAFFVPISIGIMAFIFYLNFNKFYRKFSLEAFMAATIIREKK